MNTQRHPKPITKDSRTMGKRGRNGGGGGGGGGGAPSGPPGGAGFVVVNPALLHSAAPASSTARKCVLCG